MVMKRLLQGILVMALLAISAACGYQETKNREATDLISEVESAGKPNNNEIKKQTADQPKLSEKKRPSRKIIVKGIYVSSQAFRSRKLYGLIDLVQRTELNAMVIDVKNDNGYLTYRSDIPLASEIGANGKLSKERMRNRINSLKSKGIYTIARIVTFKDPRAAEGKPDLAMKRYNGKPWKDRRGVSWVDPYKRNLWDYNIAIAEEAIALGFHEIQFDYVRFPEDVHAMNRQVHFNNPDKLNKDGIISKYLRTAKQRIHLKGATISADVFGLTTSVTDGMEIGQRWTEISPAVDVISPMVYPSHYSQGMFGIDHPDLEPYDLIRRSISDALKQNKSLRAKGIKPSSVRPWLQDFTASWVKAHQSYGKTEVLEQIRAAKELGVREYLLWNPSCKYSM